MSDEPTPPRTKPGRLEPERAIATAEDRAAVKRKIVRRLSKLASSLLASGAIEPPAQSSLEADPPARAYRSARKK